MSDKELADHIAKQMLLAKQTYPVQPEKCCNVCNWYVSRGFCDERVCILLDAETSYFGVCGAFEESSDGI